MAKITLIVATAVIVFMMCQAGKAAETGFYGGGQAIFQDYESGVSAAGKFCPAWLIRLGGVWRGKVWGVVSPAAGISSVDAELFAKYGQSGPGWQAGLVSGVGVEFAANDRLGLHIRWRRLRDFEAWKYDSTTRPAADKDISLLSLGVVIHF